MELNQQGKMIQDNNGPNADVITPPTSPPNAGRGKSHYQVTRNGIRRPVCFTWCQYFCIVSLGLLVMDIIVRCLFVLEEAPPAIHQGGTARQEYSSFKAYNPMEKPRNLKALRKFDFPSYLTVGPNLSTYVHPELETAIHEPINVCPEVPVTELSPSNGNGASVHNYTDGVFLVISVHSAVQHFENRKTIRETWGNSTKYFENTYRTRVFFSLGLPANDSDRATLQRSIDEESATYGDILQESFLDTYRNLTIKAMYTYKWILKGCQQVPYVLKVDDDVFINVYNAIEFISYLNKYSAKHLLIGHIGIGHKPRRNIKHIRYVSHESYPYNTHPPYLYGPGYLISMDVVRELYSIALTLPYISIDDVFFTGVCANVANIKPQNSALFNPYNKKKKVCSYVRMIVSHHHSDLRKVYLSPEDTMRRREECGRGKAEWKSRTKEISSYNRNIK